MQTPHASRAMSLGDMEAILTVTRALAAPFDLSQMLAEVAAAARKVLRADRASVWLMDAKLNELYVEVASDLGRISVPLGVGVVGACGLTRQSISVPDCYADPRFNPAVDLQSGYRSRCSLSLPLIDHQEALVGVLQLLNKAGGGAFDEADTAVGTALAAQCAVALTRARMTEAAIAGERLRQELELAGTLQRSILPAQMPDLPGYDMHATFLPAALTGGDTYDLALIEQGLLVVLGDATGHGIAPALSVTQMHAMLRMAFRLGATLETAFRQVNDQLAQTLPDSRFVTAFIGLLDGATHRLRFLSGGQAPILHHKAADGSCAVFRATSFPMGAMPIAKLRPAIELDMAPGDWLVLASDGIYEYEDPDGAPFGRAPVERQLASSQDASAASFADRLMQALQTHARGAPQLDDITLVVVRRRRSECGSVINL
jgi:phosphoserine phosphatase